MVAYADGPRVSSILSAWNLPTCQFSFIDDWKNSRKRRGGKEIVESGEEGMDERLGES
jgi:hypothetical protein